MLKFSFGNAKIKHLTSYLGYNKGEVASFDLPAGYTCPASYLCQSYANRETGNVTDGKNMQFRCYAVSSEAAFPATRRLRWHNFDLLAKKSHADIASEIISSLPIGIKVIRIHSSGDFFKREYFDAWRGVATCHPDIMFFGYSKILEYVQYSIDNSLPNFKLVYSIGGAYDKMLSSEPACRVVNTIEHGRSLGLPISCQNNPADDYDYIVGGQSFAIALHGTQPAGSPANKKKR